MGLPHTVSLGAFLLLSAGGVSGRWQWQRTVTPPPANPAAEQCVVLDADVYTRAAPGLRDLRLVQDGRPIPYALQESYDDAALGATRGEEDRSLYTTVLRLPLTPMGNGTAQHGEGLLPRQVPVERMQLLYGAGMLTPSVHAPIHFMLSATPAAVPGRTPAGSEVIEDQLDASRPLERTAIGANLQADAQLAAEVKATGLTFSAVLLQMHQRSICYQPLGRAPLRLLFGNPDARPVHYEYAAHYTPTATPLLAALGPTQRNPDFMPRTDRAVATAREHLGMLVAATVALITLLLLAAVLLRARG